MWGAPFRIFGGKMSFIPIENIGGENARKWLPTILPALQKLLCGAMVAQATGSNPAIVSEDGRKVVLSAWYTRVTGVTFNDNPVEFMFDPTVGDMDYTTGQVEQMYGNTLTLETKAEPGTVVTVAGTYGFDTLPASLQAVLSGMVSAMQRHADETDIITSKSIEDVSVSYQRDTSTDTLTQSIQPYLTVINMWSLCDKPLGVGGIATSNTLPVVPYWIGDGDGLGL
jgi:hypothetical protein